MRSQVTVVWHAGGSTHEELGIVTGTQPIVAPSGWGRGRGGNFKPLRESSEANSRLGEVLSVDPVTLMNALAQAFIGGCGVLMSPTSDQGALSVTVYVGDDRHRSYATTKEEFEALLEAVRDLGEAQMMGGTAKAPKKPVRGL